MKIHVLSLNYDIMFDDSDDGPTVAGEARVLIGVYRDEDTAKQICDEYNPILALAQKERIVFPVQRYNQKILDRFGFTLDSLDQNGENFVLRIETYDLV